MTLDRSTFTALDTVRHLWRHLGLPAHALTSLSLTGEGHGLPSSFQVGHLAQASIGLSGLTAALIQAQRKGCPVPRVTVPLQHAVIEFRSERFCLLDKKSSSAWGPIGGLHACSDGHVRVHDNFPHHRDGIVRLLGCEQPTTRSQVGDAISSWRAVDLETAAADNGLVVAALRSYKQWDVTPQAQAIADLPISIAKVGEAAPGIPRHIGPGKDKCLRGVRVVDMTRVVAGPVAGKTLAAHGAEVLWVTGPHLPDLPELDRDLARGKRTVQLDIRKPEDLETLMHLLESADVFLQSYRPGSLSALGLTEEAIVRRRKGRHPIVMANLSCYGTAGPWKHRRGFDSIVQTCSGMNVSEAEHYGKGDAARPLPCQALDHASGYFLAAGIMAGLYRAWTDGGSYRVDVSLAGTMKYLRSLGQLPGDSGFEATEYDYHKPEDVPAEYFETRSSGFGELQAIKHSVSVDGAQVGWDIMPQPLGSHEPKW
ncbi:hypothetical protein PV08_08829 [Exophiala spinifera]|uniref:Uncharacterized protein n=1 Tax=Exophiala spinifera TaxID=91928 RepID=A0A0D2B3Y6_9EURO|nr:uncharacterized protein PV08_08829 [Exophiala spinifera]KIW13638.1 hypothetical protein PV08_08829 [Exophiala spinifera]